jgi:hypothetical protein
MKILDNILFYIGYAIGYLQADIEVRTEKRNNPNHDR